MMRTVWIPSYLLGTVVIGQAFVLTVTSEHSPDNTPKPLEQVTAAVQMLQPNSTDCCGYQESTGPQRSYTTLVQANVLPRSA